MGPSWNLCHRRASLRHAAAVFQKLGRGWQLANQLGPAVSTWPEPIGFIGPVFDPRSCSIPDAAKASGEKYIDSN
ncbi:hypothetical protein XAC3810_10004 [Xanthomonas citri pv. citri]|uniref:Uncharacterized protein n=1 Tax=Xanthomonas citri pv. citri TaxID=611301 RepID=A0A0U5BMH4_XANCI|nr:hypothetical protein XAC3824_10004 [Xanthomonas citri pv. citri]CEE16047.1 hypothetical protein XAC9322_10004 [Xanthomonas citri pv. citri]CEE16074.1 hypothetical protein XAC1083_10004 [Xanthomonas citri pv. citri]CEE16819.1 hypothetical protein XAC902_10004 [Xanthomonas citri pv. citri]CEE21351.1 hypothetical protein XAC3810_10004 [Xanthomonas citri pv. citri]